MNAPRFRATRVLWILLLTVQVWVSPGAAQFPTSGGQRFSISGRVLYEHNNQPAEMITVSLRNFTDMGMDQTNTDAHGNFSFSVGRGIYYLSVRLPDYGEVNERVEIAGFSQTGVLLHLRRIPTRSSNTVKPATVQADYLQIPAKAREAYELGMKEFYRTENLPASLVHLRKAVELHPNFAAAYYWLGMVQIDLGEFEGARKAFEEAVRINEKLAAAYFPLGSLHLHFRDPGKAVEILTTGLGMRAQYWQGHYELARAYVTLGKVKEAEESALKAFALKPDYPRIHLLLANVYWAQEKDALALEEAEKFLTLAPEDPVAPEIRRRVDELKKLPHAKP